MVGFQNYTAISRKVVGQSTRDNSKRYCERFSVQKFERMAQATVEVCLPVLEKETKVCSTAIVQEQSKDPITPQFQDCHVHIFSDNVSRNSCT